MRWVWARRPAGQGWAMDPDPPKGSAVAGGAADRGLAGSSVASGPQNGSSDEPQVVGAFSCRVPFVGRAP